MRRTLHLMDYGSCRPIRKPLISEENRRKRLEWCLEHKAWTLDDWKMVAWSDESRYTLFSTDGRRRVWRLPHEALDPSCMVPTVQASGGSCMVWAMFSWHALGPLVILRGSQNASDYLNVLEEQVRPFMQQYPPSGHGYYQDDNAPIHRARVVTEWFASNQTTLRHLSWPAQSPDLNPIEHIWDVLERRIRRLSVQPSSLGHLETLLLEEWNRITPHIFQYLVESIPRRINAVLSAKGGPTKY